MALDASFLNVLKAAIAPIARGLKMLVRPIELGTGKHWSKHLVFQSGTKNYIDTEPFKKHLRVHS